MSLDVYLVREKWVSYDKGQTHEVDSDELYNGKITHNLREMANQAGIYEALWRPHRLHPEYNVEEDDRKDGGAFEKNHTMLAKDIIPILEKGLKDLKARPDHYKRFDSPNGWGRYINFVPFVEKYLEACKDYPDSIIKTTI